MEVAIAGPMITNNPGHVKGFSYVGFYRYSLTFRTDTRRPVFADREVVDLVVQQLLRTANEQKFAVIAYCFMPDHLHLLIEGTSDDSDGKRFMKAFKQYSGYYYAKMRRGRLWQRYGFEHILRDDEATVEVVRYILRNPVRAGLAASVEEYPFVGSLAYKLKNLL